MEGELPIERRLIVDVVLMEKLQNLQVPIVRSSEQHVLTFVVLLEFLDSKAAQEELDHRCATEGVKL